MFDNCPVGLRKVRTRTIKIAVILLIAIGLSSLAQRIEAQGLVGAPAEVGGFGRRDLCEPIPSTATVSIGSFVSFVLAVIAGFAKLLGSLNASSIQPGISATEKSIKLIKLRSVVETIILAVAAPAVFYLGCLAVRMYQQNNQ